MSRNFLLLFFMRFGILTLKQIAPTLYKDKHIISKEEITERYNLTNLISFFAYTVFVISSRYVYDFIFNTFGKNVWIRVSNLKSLRPISTQLELHVHKLVFTFDFYLLNITLSVQNTQKCLIWASRLYKAEVKRKKVDDRPRRVWIYGFGRKTNSRERCAASSPLYFTFHRQVCNPASLQAVRWLACWLCMRRYNIGKPQIGEKSDYKRRWQTETLIEKPVSDAVRRVTRRT